MQAGPGRPVVTVILLGRRWCCKLTKRRRRELPPFNLPPAERWLSTGIDPLADILTNPEIPEILKSAQAVAMNMVKVTEGVVA